MLTGKKSVLYFVAGFCLLLAGDCNAETAPESELWLFYSQDEFQAKDYLASISLSINNDDRILFSLGRSESEFLNEQITTNQVTLGYGSLRLAPFALDIFYDYWGKHAELEIDSFNVGLTYYAQGWAIGVPVEYQNIEFFTREISGSQRRFTVEGYGLGLNFQVGGKHLSWLIDGMWYDYSENLQDLNTARSLFILGAKNLNHATIISDWLVSSSLRYRWVDTSIALLAVHSVSAIDQAESDNVALNLSVDVNQTVSLSVEVGRVFERFDLTTDYMSAGVGIAF